MTALVQRKDSTADVVEVESAELDLADAVRQLQAVAANMQPDDISLEYFAENTGGGRGRQHLRFRCYRRSTA